MVVNKAVKKPTKATIDFIFQALTQANPRPETELCFANEFQLLLAVAFSAQTTDVAVNKATENLFSQVYTPEDLLSFGIERLTKEIQSIGLYRNKARHAMACAQKLIDDHDSMVPQSMEALIALPGVGRKTANVILNTAFGLPTIAVDTHVFRLARRLGLSKGKDVLQVEHDLLKTIPSAYLQDAHHHLILHGRYVCKARSPLCAECILADYCPSFSG